MSLPEIIWYATDVSLCLKLVSQISFGPISWLMVSEIFPLRTRGRGISLAVLTNFGSNALVTFAFSPLKVKVNIIFSPGHISCLELQVVPLVFPQRSADLCSFFAGVAWS